MLQLLYIARKGYKEVGTVLFFLKRKKIPIHWKRVNPTQYSMSHQKHMITVRRKRDKKFQTCSENQARRRSILYVSGTSQIVMDDDDAWWDNESINITLNIDVLKGVPSRGMYTLPSWPSQTNTSITITSLHFPFFGVFLLRR